MCNIYMKHSLNIFSSHQLYYVEVSQTDFIQLKHVTYKTGHTEHVTYKKVTHRTPHTIKYSQ